MYTALLAPHRSSCGSNVKEQLSLPTTGFTSSGALDASIFNGSTHPQCKNQRATPSLAIPPFDPHHQRDPKSTCPSLLSQQSDFQRTAIVLSTLPTPDRVLPFRVRQQSECATAAPNVRPQQRTARIPSVNSAVKQTTRAVPTLLTASQLPQMLPTAIPPPSRIRQLSSLYLTHLQHPPPLPQLQRSCSTALPPQRRLYPPRSTVSRWTQHGRLSIKRGLQYSRERRRRMKGSVQRPEDYRTRSKSVSSLRTMKTRTFCASKTSLPYRISICQSLSPSSAK
ncbi:hypothetical protein B0H14DRAFT_2942644 [Mycena olivaceomarginata]|nr:hypothetical protein B0H14DRAFT_2942644 [Mycena olivaceomarginata]